MSNVDFFNNGVEPGTQSFIVSLHDMTSACLTDIDKAGSARVGPLQYRSNTQSLGKAFPALKIDGGGVWQIFHYLPECSYKYKMKVVITNTYMSGFLWLIKSCPQRGVIFSKTFKD